MVSPPPHLHHEGMTAPWHDMTDEQRCRWAEVLGNLADVLPQQAATAVVDGPDGYAGLVADRLAGTVEATGRPCARLTDTTPLADEDAWRADRGHGRWYLTESQAFFAI